MVFNEILSLLLTIISLTIKAGAQMHRNIKKSIKSYYENMV